jgi:hypothetical protein
MASPDDNRDGRRTEQRRGDDRHGAEREALARADADPWRPPLGGGP